MSHFSCACPICGRMNGKRGSAEYTTEPLVLFETTIVFNCWRCENTFSRTFGEKPRLRFVDITEESK